MSELLKKYQGKLYDKEGIMKWVLPKRIEDLIGLDDFDYFFLTSSKEEKHGMRHIHFSLYPTKFDRVHLIELKVPEINPQLLSNVLNLLKKEMNYQILTSTGFCKGVNSTDCHFGVFFSSENEIPKDLITSNIKKLENVEKIAIYSYSCDGCTEI